jgi:hypothetical protein
MSFKSHALASALAAIIATGAAGSAFAQTAGGGNGAGGGSPGNAGGSVTTTSTSIWARVPDTTQRPRPADQSRECVMPTQGVGAAKATVGPCGPY